MKELSWKEIFYRLRADSFQLNSTKEEGVDIMTMSTKFKYYYYISRTWSASY